MLQKTEQKNIITPSFRVFFGTLFYTSFASECAKFYANRAASGHMLKC